MHSVPERHICPVSQAPPGSVSTTFPADGKDLSLQTHLIDPRLSKYNDVTNFTLHLPSVQLEKAPKQLITGPEDGVKQTQP